MRRALAFLSIVSLITLAGCADRAREGEAARTADADAYPTREAAPPPNPQAQAGSPTAFDQSERPEDLDITKRIRQAVVDDSTLSVASKNVTIVTNQGKVVLKGEVPSQTEATRLVTIAEQVAGTTNVNNQLEVKSLG